MSRIENVALHIFTGREGDEAAWDMPIPAPLHHWTVPIAVMEGDSARRVGTGFHYSRLGHLFTARHCVDEALRPRDRGIEIGQSASRVRPVVPLIVLRAADDQAINLTGLTVQTVAGTEPTDLVCLTTMFQDHLPQVTLPLSFALPDAGSVVHCFGFPEGDSSLFPDRLHVVRGTVKAYFPPRFSRGFMKGPCFLVDAAVPPGMSGGPVLNEAGAVCGVVSAGAELFFNEPGYLATPIYPFLLMRVAVHATPSPELKINSTLTFLEMCEQGLVRTDGTEGRVHFLEMEDGVEIGPLISKENAEVVYNSLDDYLEGRPSTPIAGPRMRIVVHSDPE